MTRTLDIVPIVHNEADLGALAPRLREHAGASAWEERQRVIAAAWEAIAAWADGIDAAGLFLYQDGLPVDGDAGAIAADLAARGSLNYRVVLGLVDRGATLVGTEDPALLVREVEIARAAAEAVGHGRRPDPRDAERSAAVLARRDRFIAARIAQTLPPEGRGVLFIGALHGVEHHLPTDVQTTHPLGRPGTAAFEKEPAR